MVAVMAQGLWVRQRTEVLPPAEGPTTGLVGQTAEVNPLRLAVLGESTAAGCGVANHGEGFAGALAELLSKQTGRPVAWQVVGEHGATARRIRYRLLLQLEGDFDLAVVLAGANDVLTRRAPHAWGQDLAAILKGLADRAERIAVVGTPPFAAFPSLPKALRTYLADRASAIDGVTQGLCESSPHVDFVGSEHSLVDHGFFARDGFHPSVHGYQRWAELVAETLSRQHGVVGDPPPGSRPRRTDI